jgi:hypothetical protein
VLERVNLRVRIPASPPVSSPVLLIVFTPRWPSPPRLQNFARLASFQRRSIRLSPDVRVTRVAESPRRAPPDSSACSAASSTDQHRERPLSVLTVSKPALPLSVASRARLTPPASAITPTRAETSCSTDRLRLAPSRVGPCHSSSCAFAPTPFIWRRCTKRAGLRGGLGSTGARDHSSGNFGSQRQGLIRVAARQTSSHQ